ncbi:MAG: addiction module protein [Pseudomonadales bacterium]
MKENEIKNMSVNERLKAMEILWSTFLNEGAAIESPDWHKGILADRKAKIENGEAKFISLDQLKKYYRGRH